MSEDRQPSPRRIPPAVWIVPAIVVVLGAAAFLVLKASGGGGILGTGGPANTLPAFEFDLTKALSVSTTATKINGLTPSTNQVAREVSKTMTELYTEAFLDPSNWRDGTYDNVWSLFDREAAGAAQKDVGVLTVGPTAGSGYDTIEPVTGTLVVKVLHDRQDQPFVAVAMVRFTANATSKDHSLTALVSSGQYFLHKTANGWTIYSFEVDRGDHPATPKPGPSGTPTAVAS